MKNDSQNHSRWQLKTKTLAISQTPLIMGIVNATPDSFSDGGNYRDPEDAIAHGLRLAAEGADIIDIGGESTRPYSEPVSAEQEIERVVRVIQGIAAKTDVPISIDTSKAVVATAAIQAGAEIINDVTGLTGDPDMLKVAADSGVGVCAMHMQGTPQNMQDNPCYQNVTREIYAYLAQRKSTLVDAGLKPTKICLDPGIGFGKSHDHNLQLLRDCHQFHELGCPLLIGHSRKGFIGKLINDNSPQTSPLTIDQRDAGTLAITLQLAQQGIQLIRVHEVANTIAALTTQHELRATHVSCKENGER